MDSDKAHAGHHSDWSTSSGSDKDVTEEVTSKNHRSSGHNGDGERPSRWR